MSHASDITRRAKSNLAFALTLLPKERRDEMVVFYAFCRTMDDLADDPVRSLDERRSALESWRTGLQDGFTAPDGFQQEVIALRDLRQIPTPLLVAIIEGCLTDLLPQRFRTWDDLTRYIWQVAGAVGLVSIRLFGCKDPASEAYAVTLAQALQLTNILRDIREDLDNDARVYLPLDDLARHGYAEADLLDHVADGRFLALMTAQADKAADLFRQAAALEPAADRAALRPARVMAEVYATLLDQMRADGFRVFQKRYRLSTVRKFVILSKHLIE